MSRGWSDALVELAARLEHAGVEWMLVGSAATAVRGAAIEPGDIDVAVATPAGVRTAAEVLPCRADSSPTADPATWYISLAEPTLMFVDPADARWTFGRWMLAGVKVELAHIDARPPADLLIETSGTAVWKVRSALDWKGASIPVVPLEAQLATMIVRDQMDRLQATFSAVDPASVDVAMLRRALADRETAGAVPLRVPDAIHRLL